MPRGRPLERDAWWQKAREDAKRYTALYGWIPDSLSQEHQDLLFENLYEYVSMLLAEIIASPDAECTYFREQLPWFHAGHFPCGYRVWTGANCGCQRAPAAAHRRAKSRSLPQPGSWIENN